MAIHGVVRTDLMTGTDNRAYMVSVKYKDGADFAKIDNGCVVKVGGLLSGERELHEATDMTPGDKLTDLALIATPEVMYDERLKDLSDFYNEKGAASRAYRLDGKNIFSVTKEALVGLASPMIGNFVDTVAGNKLSVSAASGNDTIGSIIDVETVGTRKYFVIELS